MTNNYIYIKNNLMNVTDLISKNVISLDNIIDRDIMQKNLESTKYDNELISVRGEYATYHLSYGFIINNEVYQIVLLDNYKRSSWTTLDDWDCINMFKRDEIDMKYIMNSNHYEIYHYPIKWFYNDDNLGAMCENEMKKILPLIRKQKIKKILKIG